MNYYGKYRAIVTQISDPNQRGRIRVRCPKIYGESESPYCTPCVPFAGDQVGLFTLPSVDDLVWIEFEEGDVSKPLYVGGWWSKDNSPLGEEYSDADNTKLIKTKSGHTLLFYDKEGNEYILIKDKYNNSITLSQEGVIIDSKADINLTHSGTLKSNGTRVAVITDIT